MCGKEYFQKYMQAPGTSLEEDCKLFTKVFEQEFVDNAALEAILEDINLLWVDDLAYSLTWCCRTLEDLASGQTWKLPELYQSDMVLKKRPDAKVDSDKDFATKLVRCALAGYEKYFEKVVTMVPDWDRERLFSSDMAIIACAMAEIENFKPEPYWVLTTDYRDTTFTAVMEEGERGFRSEEEGRKALEKISDLPFTVTSVEKKKGKEAPPRLFDLTSLQVECNKKFSLSADTTLQLIQSLYEKKITTYPRVDTTFLPDDVYPKCKGILNGIAGQYSEILQPLRGEKLRKSKKVFDSSKVTDHHAIIPTGVAPNNLTELERKVFDLVARRFIAAFYPDMEFMQTTVLGEVADVKFRVGGKQITLPAWKVVFAKDEKDSEADDEGKKGDEERTLADFKKGESGPHKPGLAQKMTQPPKPYTEATLLRAMETAGRSVENEELRDALKENGIGRPSTRAAIIETLFRRQYIRKNRKTLVATPMGVALIGIIQEELLKSAELTGIWERNLRRIEKKEYSPAQFIDEMKKMISDIVAQVLSDTSGRKIQV